MKLALEIGKVYTFKLNSGEELIAKVESQNEYSVQLNEPVSVAPGPQGIGLVPSLFTGDRHENASLNINSVSLFVITDEEVRMKYVQATTGITVPEKKLILG
jgi:hypothetical protein